MQTENRVRYDILDGLRGVAALMVLLYHLFNDAKSFYVWPTPVLEFYHGFLGVDFFFILSGFVMGYAYDRQWSDGMTLGSFIRRRLIRLHPMVVMGVLLGAVAFLVQGSAKWDGTEVGIQAVMLATLLALFLIPAPTSLDVRGNTESFPLNGPHWSLFFEYIGSLLYGLMLRRLSDRWLRVWVAASICSLAAFALLMDDGGVAYGWSSEPTNILGGALRMLYAYPMGLLMARVFRQRNPKPLRGHVFMLGSLALVALLGMPSLIDKDAETMYQLVCLLSLFPALIWFAARGTVTGWRQQTVSFLGRLSYPLYAVHFPFVYLFIAWVGRDGHPYEGYSQPWLPLLLTFVVSLVVAVLSMLLYDEPLRRRLSKSSRK